MTVSKAGRGVNSASLRLYNERALLLALRRAGEASKADLARMAQLTNTAVGSIVQTLADEGLVEQAGRRTEGQRGQPASLIRLKAKGAFGIGVRLDRGSIETVMVDFAGELLASQAHQLVLPHPEQALELVRRDIEAMRARLGPGEQKRLLGIGVAQPYNLGAWLRELDVQGEDFQASFRAWDEADFAAMLNAVTGLPVFSENDGTAAAVAELFYGRHHAQHFLYVFLGPAIGGGVVLNGDCVRGVSGNAGDIAMMPVPPSALPSAPAPAGKRRDLLLSRASLNALTRHLRYHGVAVAGHADLQRQAELGHPAVAQWIDDCVDALAPALQAALAVLDVPMVIFDADIDGGLVPALIDRLQQALADSAPEARTPATVVRGCFGANAGAVGAASLPMFMNFSPRAELLKGASAIVPEARHAVV
ncbi:ROK family protein [Cupriavidus oxalaticus]|uniref:N-acylmannosamine kinase n=1 Tax=Cupriavidus oxalaticus TaxID=96344 RepID=A0A375FQJ6_9BURK|nr:ROK family protein [Cupriavidus oxalaticus]QRQ85424.1 ROK family protein [Cupriavidus oxalaticus]QRQ90488.1 ROK family protein [Cupriavidus oxalaticus]WQD85006.1 ROK family protein [Cupriavidus oxalaticus]SPC08356.1 N-acylmannosamine kinase [Cupriavidus oxalaticus]SPC24220.1 N-acylmannosamine kinase [Cupriavidus oxalaticus]